MVSNASAHVAAAEPIRAVARRAAQRRPGPGGTRVAAPIESSAMSKKTKKRKAKMRRSKANHGKRPNMGRG
jgi:hypothetical protein